MHFLRVQEWSVVHAGLTFHLIEVAHNLSSEPLRRHRPRDLHLDPTSVSYVEVYRGGSLK